MQEGVYFERIQGLKATDYAPPDITININCEERTPLRQAIKSPYTAGGLL